MAILFKDFAPAATKKQTLIFVTTTVGSFEDAVMRANRWVDERSVDVINVETVVLPEMHSEDGTTDTELTTSGEMRSQWYQFVRVWYRT